jgi:hypothetical protein
MGQFKESASLLSNFKKKDSIKNAVFLLREIHGILGNNSEISALLTTVSKRKL